MIKLIALTAVKEFENETISLLKKAGIPVWSKMNMDGFKNSEVGNLGSNWFSSSRNSVNSILIFSFVETERIEMMKELVQEFNKTIESENPIHFAVINVEQFI